MHIVLYQPQIPPNTGNIARLCVATKTRLHLIKPLGFSTDDAALKRAGLDYWQWLKVEYHESWADFQRRYPQANLYFLSKKAKRFYTDASFNESDFLVFGAETTGLPEVLLTQYADRTLTIPMWGPTRSLNLSTSVGIVLYEALRQISGSFSAFQPEA